MEKSIRARRPWPFGNRDMRGHVPNLQLCVLWPDIRQIEADLAAHYPAADIGKFFVTPGSGRNFFFKSTLPLHWVRRVCAP